jgi:4-amino-4-deoxy-L-arabinose transferase-like glycosyltransferase
LLLAGCYALVKKRCGVWPAFVAVLALLAAPQVLELSVSAMLEVPAMAVGLWALWPVYQWADSAKGRRPSWLIASGLFLAVALQIKLTAAIFAPALCAEIVLATTGLGVQAAKERARDLLLWCGSAAAGFALLGLVFGSGYHTAWASHFSARAHGAVSATGYSFDPALLLDHLDGLAGACAACVLGAWTAGLRRIRFPGALFLTVAAIHFVHRPWWPYYYLHFAIPMAWLTGYAVFEMSRLPFQTNAKRVWWGTIGLIAALVSAATFLALVLLAGGDRLVSEVRRIRGQPRIENSRLIAAMREHAARARWVYVCSTIYAFHARLPVPPELAVVVKKRFWSGQISDAEILEIIRRYAPEQIVVNGEDFLSDDSLRKEGYTLRCESEAGTLYVSRSLP